MFDYIKVRSFSGDVKIVSELSDDLFDNGYRFIEYVPNKDVDILELDAIQEEETLLRMAGSSTDPFYWIKDENDDSGSYYESPIEIY